ncbi:hypothetical protein CCACVL1_28383 [Corchorus capsularis]|uniref:Uncharacterized protein n=1 Tax=Corchorus capsularis TaxID=210143 RepID=A0A1R3G6N2_COCAP|nr:hypothetical protein CCACVL1_28383 [Corchorus capsularis]
MAGPDLFEDAGPSAAAAAAANMLQKSSQAYQLFDEMPDPNVVSYTSVMSGYVNVGPDLFEDAGPQPARWPKIKKTRPSPLLNRPGFKVSTPELAFSASSSLLKSKKNRTK